MNNEEDLREIETTKKHMNQKELKISEKQEKGKI